MSGVVWATAVYHVNRPGIMVVTEEGDTVGKDVPVVMTQDEPTTRGLVSTPWAAAPGSRWEIDEQTGAWWISVFRREDPRSGA